MKTNNAPIKLIVLLSALAALVIATSIGQESPPPIREFSILVNPTNFLAATSLRMTFDEVTLHPVTGKPLIAVNLEAWAEEEEDGVTNNVVIRRQRLTMTTVQLNAWNNATDGFLFLQNAMLNRAKLTLRTE